MLSFLRKTEKVKDTLVVVANFANVEQEFTIGVPYEGKYKEILNTDAKCYGGLGRVNGQAIFVDEEETDSKPYSFKMTSAPLSISIFTYVPYTAKEKQMIAKRKARLEAEAKAEEARLEAEQAKAQAQQAKAEAEEAIRQAREAEARAKAAEKKAEEELQKAREELARAETIRKEEEKCSQAVKAE